MDNFIPAGVEWTISFQLELNGPFHSSWNVMDHFIPSEMEWPISFWPEWNGPFHSGQNGMAQFIPAGMEWPILFRPEWTAPFRPEWKGPFNSVRIEMSIPQTQMRNMQPGRLRGHSNVKIHIFFYFLVYLGGVKKILESSTKQLPLPLY